MSISNSKQMQAASKQRSAMNKLASCPDDWYAVKEMLLNIRLAVAVEPRPDAAIRHLARTWFSADKYAVPACKAMLIKLMASKKANKTLGEMIALYLELEEKE